MTVKLGQKIINFTLPATGDKNISLPTSLAKT